MIFFAEGALVHDSVLTWMVIGIVAGFFAGVVMAPGKYGVVGDMSAGLAGALLGGVVTGLLVGGTAGVVLGILVAALVAGTLIATLRVVAPLTHRP